MDTDKKTEMIIGCAMTVSNELGSGFLEKVYENALFLELKNKGMKVEPQKSMEVKYKGSVVGEYFADILVDDQIILEIKAAKDISEARQAQLLNYLKATGFKVGLFLNFGTPRMGIKRMIL